MKEENTHPLIIKARQFASRAHSSIDQRRKYTNEPCIIHPAAVAATVSAVTNDVHAIAAAWLHDVVEDTPVTLDEIEAEFGSKIAKLVEEVTDVSRPEDGNRRIRKAIDRDHLAKASPLGMTIKLADLIDNSNSIVRHDPEFSRTYLREKQALLEVLTAGDAMLYRRAKAIVDDYFTQGAAPTHLKL